jgi:hypothetical protein
MRRKWLIYILTFSLAVNGATAAAFVFFWWQSRPSSVSVGQKPITSFLREDLSLTSDQSSEILSQINWSKQEAGTLRALMDSKRTEMIDLITSVPVNRDLVETKISEINRIQGSIRSSAVKTVVTILESLPPEPRERFGAYIQARGRACDECGPWSQGVGKAVLGR